MSRPPFWTGDESPMRHPDLNFRWWRIPGYLEINRDGRGTTRPASRYTEGHWNGLASRHLVETSGTEEPPRRVTARLAVGVSPGVGAYAAILRASSWRIATTALSRSLGFSVIFVATLNRFLSNSVPRSNPAVHKIQLPNRIRQTIGRIGKVESACLSVWFE